MTDNGTCESNLKPRLSWTVIGGSGFVGNGIVKELQSNSVEGVHILRAPRLRALPIDDVAYFVDYLYSYPRIGEIVKELKSFFRSTDVVVNAAGVAAPDARASYELFGANSLLPLVIAEAAKQANVSKVLHISSAAVQGAKDVLDETSYVAPFSPYSLSKALGERALDLWRRGQALKSSGKGKRDFGLTIIRATSVQGSGRQTSDTLHRIASSKFSSVAAPGTQPSVVSSLEGLAEFVFKIGSYEGQLPHILIQPWEGGSVRQILELASNGQSPRILPTWLARSGVTSLRSLGLMHPRIKGLARRLEVMWFGQQQVPGWSVSEGIMPSISEPQVTLTHALKRKPSE